MASRELTVWNGNGSMTAVAVVAVATAVSCADPIDRHPDHDLCEKIAAYQKWKTIRPGLFIDRHA